jgi:hypothetical protein
MGEIFNAPITETTTIWEDNQSAIEYSQNALVSEKTKHIGLKWHFLKDHMEQGTMEAKGLSVAMGLFLPGPALTRNRSAILGGKDPLQRLIP